MGKTEELRKRILEMVEAYWADKFSPVAFRRGRNVQPGGFQSRFLSDRRTIR